MKKFGFLFLFLICFLFSIRSQYVAHPKQILPQPPDSVDIVYYKNKKNGWHAAAQVVGFNVGLWAFDRYVQKGDFAYISFDSMKRNLKKGFIWDNDKLGTNLFLHPYHGNLYHNSARSNGFTFWESGLFCAGGSLMWELFMECEYPSTNDVIATPIGGMALGEVLYRASDAVLDDRATGRDRWGNELTCFILSPMRSLTRMINGDFRRVRKTSGRQFGTPPIMVEVSAGIRAVELEDDILDEGLGGLLDIRVEYGDRFDHDGVKPYDYFTLHASLNAHSSQPVLGQLNIIGRLYGTDLLDDKNDYLGLGFYQHFDFYDSDTISDISGKIPYKFGSPASVGVGLSYKTKRFENWHFDACGHINGIILGSSLSDYYALDERNYNWGSGFSWKLNGHASYKDKVGFSWWHEAYNIYTWKGYPKDVKWPGVDPKTLDAQGDKSNAFLHTYGLKTDIKLKNSFYLTLYSALHSRVTKYAYYPAVKSTTTEQRLLLSYKF